MEKLTGPIAAEKAQGSNYGNILQIDLQIETIPIEITAPFFGRNRNAIIPKTIF